ncbi:hypothetical protein cypCar_00038111 [Cyprinus carpio]|nr:hypothetical protein cypCar_00038111 [Cyprinus carpio]
MSWSNIFILMIIIPLTFCQSVKGKVCVCDLINSDPAFPEQKLTKVETISAQCIRSITSERMTNSDRLLLGLQQRIKQLDENVLMLEKEDDRNLYGAVSLRIIELEFAEIQDLLNKLNSTNTDYYHLNVQTAAQLDDMKATMAELEKFDNMQVIKKDRENQLVKRDLEQCKNDLKATLPPPTVPPGRCGLGEMVSVVGPRTYSITVYSTSYPYGAWGRDANPAPGDENKYWLVVLTSSNVYGYYVRQYSTLSTLLLGLGPKDTYIASSNPTTNTIQGSNMVMYANALYYNCYYKYSVYKETEQIFYSYDTKTKEERFDLKINIKKMQNNIEFLNYDPRDHLLYAYSDAYIVTYELVFK